MLRQSGHCAKLFACALGISLATVGIPMTLTHALAADELTNSTNAIAATSPSLTSTATLTEGWTRFQDTCEYYMDDEGNVTLRPLGGAGYAELTDLDGNDYGFWSGLDPKSFKVEGSIEITGTGGHQGLHGAFYCCQNLVSVDLSGLVTDEAVSCSSLFWVCPSLTSVKLPATLRASSVGGMFYHCSELDSVDLSGLVTDKAVDCGSLFQSCTSLASVQLPTTLRASDVSSMFSECGKLAAVDLSCLVTDEAVDCGEMFFGCSALTSVEFPASLGASSLSGMFRECSKLVTVDLSCLVTDEAVDCAGVFSGCSALTAVELPEMLRASSLSDSYNSGMFYNCSKLTSVDLSGLVTDEAVSCSGLFQSCSSLASVQLPTILRASDASRMFFGCSKLTYADLSGLVTNEAVGCSNLFNGCFRLESVQLPTTLRASSLGYMFYGCSKLTSADLSGLVTDKAVDCDHLFYNCYSLTSILFPENATVRLSSCANMFSNCISLTSIDVACFDTAGVTSMSYMFSGCVKLGSIDVSGFNTSSVTSMYGMFADCSALKALDLSNFDTSSTTNMGSMFFECANIAILDLSSFDTSLVTNFQGLFDGMSSLKNLDLSSFDTSSAYEFDGLFGYGWSTYPDTIKIGDKFNFNGVWSERKCNFPSQSNSDIYTGKWISSVDGIAYAANEIPNNVAATYTAQKEQIVFADVSSTTAHSADIEWLASSGVSTGWTESDGTRTFRPFTGVVRADMAAFLYRMAGSPEYTAPDVSPFADVNTSTAHYKEICWLAESGISQGWAESDGTKTFRPYTTVVRADMAAFLYRLAGSPGYDVSGKPFADCGEDTAHYKEVCWLASTGVSQGWTEADGTKTFRPYTTVVRADMAAFLHRMRDKGLS